MSKTTAAPAAPARPEASDAAFASQLNEYMCAGYQALFIPTSEEARVEHEIEKIAAEQLRTDVITWDQFEGFAARGNTTLPAEFGDKTKWLDPVVALRALLSEKWPKKCTFIFRDLDDMFAIAAVRRAIRSLCIHLRLVNEAVCHPLIILSPKLDIHPKLRSVLTVLEFNLPDEDKLRLAFDYIRRSIQGKDPSRAECSPELADAIVANLLGMTRVEAENTLAKCLVHYRGFKPEMLRMIKDEKASIVRKSEVLTYVHEEVIADRTAIGGYDEFLQFVDRRALAYRRSARLCNLDYPKGVVLLGVPGCVADDTMVSYLRGNRKSGVGRRLSIRDFHDKFNKAAESGGRLGAKWQDGLDTYLQSYDAETGRIIHNRVLGVYDKGEKPCVRIETDGAGIVTLTYDHPVLIHDGTFKAAGELELGEQLLVRGSMKPRTADSSPAVRRQRVVVEALKYYPHGWPKTVTEPTSGKVYTYQRTHRARLVVEARMNGLDYDEFVRILKEDQARAETLVYLDPSLEVHHLDENPLNDEIGNLNIMTKAEHTRLHCDETRFNVEYTALATVTRIDDAGMRRTYDISMEFPTANFVVNDGIVVHNTGKSMVALATGRMLNLPVYTLDVGAIFGSLVGESESRMRDALRQITAQQGCVLLIDEADKAWGGSHDSRGDSGVTQRVFGQLLSWLAAKQDRTFVIMTMNRTNGIPPEFLRKGRFDEVFFVDLPDTVQRRQIFDIHLRKRGINIDAMQMTADEWQEIMGRTESFVGSEIEAAVIESRFLAFQRNEANATMAPELKAQPTFEDLLDAVTAIKPLATLDSEGVNAIREFCQSRARNVCSPKSVTRTQPNRSLRV